MEIHWDALKDFQLAEWKVQTTANSKAVQLVVSKVQQKAALKAEKWDML
jgi:hypothetical protein